MKMVSKLKKVIGVLMAFALVVVSILSINMKNVKASGEPEIKVTYTDDISVYETYTPATMVYNEMNFNGNEGLYKFKLDTASAIMININSYDVYKYSEKNTSVGALNFDIYMDEGKINKVVSLGSISGNAYKGAYYLEAGTYYLSAKFTSESDVGYGNFKVGVLMQPSNSTENVIPSSYNKPNTISGSEFRTFITGINTEDWFKYTVTEESLRKFTFSRVSGTGALQATLFNGSKVELYTTNISDGFSEVSIEKYLTAGDYYIRIKGASSSSNTTTGGDVKCSISSLKYSMDTELSTKAKTNQDIEIYIDANFEVYSSILVKQSRVKVTEQTKNDAKVWNNSVSSGNDTIRVTENGKYYLLVKDKLGNVIFKKITVSNIDKKAPNNPSVSKYKKGTAYVEGKGEKGSTILVVVGSRDSNNNYTEKEYKGTVSSKTGKYKVKVKKLKTGDTVVARLRDKAGNESGRVNVYVK